MRPHYLYSQTRRDFLSNSCCGFGALAFASMLYQEDLKAAAKLNPLAPKAPHQPQNAKAKSVIFLFMAGGPSHIETFDPKPLLNKLDGQTIPPSFGEVKYPDVAANGKLLGVRRGFQKYGRSGIEVSDLLPHTAQCIDDIAVIRSFYADMIVHAAAQYQLFSGRVIPGFPSMGSWTIFGLGSEGESLPAYVVMPDPKGALEGGQPMYGQGFLPSVYQPTLFRPGPKPVLNLELPKGVTIDQRRESLRLLRTLNEASMRRDDDELAARINAYDVAFRMQTEVPGIFNMSNEPEATREMYGIGKEPTDDYGRRCLLARRLVEKGVRFVCVVSGGGPGNMQWDAHGDIEENHLRMAAQTDKPVAALLQDLKRRGMLDSTLVLWGGEFGRSPQSQGAKGRDHHNYGFTMWLAGGGIQGGQVVGATDELGLRAVEKRYHFRDLHTTMLHQLGLDQDALSYLHQGRKERLTEVHGKVIQEIV